MEITATIDGRVKTITEASIRRYLKLEDSDGISTLPNTEIFKQLALMGAKKTAWDQFSSNIATAIICLATDRTFNFSKLIFDGMLKNLDNQSKFLMYPRFIQIFLNKHKRQLLPHKRTYIAPTPAQKLFGNMRRISKGYNGVDIPLFPTMLVQGLIFQEEAATMPHDSPLLRVHLLGSDEGSITLHELVVLFTTLSKKVESLESDLKQTKLTYGVAYTKLIMKVKKLENRIKSSKARRRVRLIVSEDEGDLEDPSKQGRKIARLDEDEGITLIQMGAQTQGRHEHDLEPDFDFTAPEEVYTDEPDISTANVPCTSEEVQQSKDKSKAIMKEAEHVQKKTKFQLEQERLGYEEALRLQEQLDEEERQKIARVHEEANAFNAEEWDNIQAQIEADEELAQTIEKRDYRMKLVELGHQRKKFNWLIQRTKAKRNKPMTPTQQKAYMSTYIKNQEGGYSIKQLKLLSFEHVKEIFEATIRRVQSFVPMDSSIGGSD
ncbi:hypothetical protein Tco_1077561 [Tanacetum coccineum]